MDVDVVEEDLNADSWESGSDNHDTRWETSINFIYVRVLILLVIQT